MKIKDTTAELLVTRYHQLVKASEAYATAESKDRDALGTKLETAMGELNNLGLNVLDDDTRFPLIRTAYERAANLLCPSAEQTTLSAAITGLGQRRRFARG